MLRASKRSSPSGLASSASSSVWSGLDICARGSPIRSVARQCCSWQSGAPRPLGGGSALSFSCHTAFPAQEFFEIFAAEVTRPAERGGIEFVVADVGISGGIEQKPGYSHFAVFDG